MTAVSKSIYIDKLNEMASQVKYIDFDAENNDKDPKFKVRNEVIRWSSLRWQCFTFLWLII